MDTAEKIRFGFSVFGVAVLHFLGTYMLAFISGTTGGPFMKLMTNILTFPISVLPSSDNMPPLVGWGVWVGTSVGWAFLICWAARLATPR